MCRWTRTLPLALVVLLLPLACGGDDGASASSSDWEHTRTTEGDVTTVRTLAGSTWGGEAMLARELSIGQLEGPDEYAFARIGEVWWDGERVLVVDNQLPVVRVYDASGLFVRQIGGPGQGPGEYEFPAGVATFPDGRIVVHDGVKLLIYDAEGEFLEQWGGADSAGGGRFRFFGPDMTAVGDDGTFYVRTPIFAEQGSGRRGMIGGMRWGMTPWSPEGERGEILPVPEIDWQPPTMEVSVGQGRASMRIPFAPDVVWTLLPDGSFAAGVNASYEFTIYRPDGSRLVIAKEHEPVAVNPDEVRLEQMQTRIIINGQRPEIDWSTADLPEHKPAYDALVATRDGRILVIRSGAATVDPACLGPEVTSEDIETMDCIDGIRWADLFESDGTFLGTFEIPYGVNLGSAWIEGETILTSAQDEYGTVTVEKLRIVPPGGMPPT